VRSRNFSAKCSGPQLGSCYGIKGENFPSYVTNGNMMDHSYRTFRVQVLRGCRLILCTKQGRMNANADDLLADSLDALYLIYGKWYL